MLADASIRENARSGTRDARNEDMIEPYFALWLNVRNEQMKKESLIDATRASWKVMTFFERTVFVIFVIVAGIATTFNFGALFDPHAGRDDFIDTVPRCDARNDSCGGLVSQKDAPARDQALVVVLERACEKLEGVGALRPGPSAPCAGRGDPDLE